MELNININVTGLEKLVNPIMALVKPLLAALGTATESTATQASINAMPNMPTMAAPTAAAQNTVPVQASAPVTAPVQNATVPVTSPVAAPTVQNTAVPVTAPVQNTVPTSTVTYTLPQLKLAAGQLVSTGRQSELCALLAKFGAQAMDQIPEQYYAAFAAELRGMGANL